MTKYLLIVEDEIWRKFTKEIPRYTNINDYLIELIKKDIDKKEELKYGN
jgi:hypothetical protein